MADQGNIVCELAFADTADIPKQVLSADEPVDSNNKVRSMRKYRRGGNLEVKKRIVIAQQHVWRLQALHVNLGYLRAVQPNLREAEQPG
jgi:hypothetical protein